MFATFRSRFSGLGRLPRLVAVGVLLMLAALSALGSGPQATPSPSSSSPSVLQPKPGQVAVEVTLADGGAWRRFLHPGDTVQLLRAGPFGEPPAFDPTVTRIPDVTVLSVVPENAPAPSGISAGLGSTQTDGTRLVVSVAAADVPKLAATAAVANYAVLD
jgi:hypothetical protein